MLGEMSDRITIIYPDISTPSGTKTYVTNFLKGMDRTGLPYRKIPIKKSEISFAGKPMFGFLSQYITSNFKRSNTAVSHSLSPSAIVRGTNLVTVHDVIPFLNRDIYLKSFLQKTSFTLTMRRILHTQYLLLSSNTSMKQFLSCVDMDEGRLFVVPHAIDHDIFYPTKEAKKFPDNKISIVMVSDFNPRKRVDIAVKALSNDPDIEFYHIGPDNAWSGNRSQIQKLSAGAKNIHFMGEMNIESIRSNISSADFFLFLTDNEGFGLPPLEALACGTNVIVSDLEIFHETMGDFAFYVRNEDFSSDFVKKLLNRKKKKEELVSYSMKYSIDNLALNSLKVYKRIME